MRSMTVRGITIGLFAAVLAACRADELAYPPVQPPEATLGSISVAPSVAIMAVGETQQLTVSAASLANTPMSDLDSVIFYTNTPADTTRVRLSASGLITALTPSTSPIRVNAVAFRQNVARGYQVVLQVTEQAETGLTLSIQPVAPDSARLSAFSIKNIVPSIRNPSTGAGVANPVMRYATTDSSRLTVFNPALFLPTTVTWGFGTGSRPANEGGNFLQPNQVRANGGGGAVWIYAEASVYGTILRDSVQYTLTYPYSGTIETVKEFLAVKTTFANQVLTLAPGATVTFSNMAPSGDAMTVAYTFDDPLAAGATSPASTIGGNAGNVTALAARQISRRTFTTRGTYTWTATASGPAPWGGQTQTGTIVIK